MASTENKSLEDVLVLKDIEPLLKFVLPTNFSTDAQALLLHLNIQDTKAAKHKSEIVRLELVVKDEMMPHGLSDLPQ